MDEAPLLAAFRAAGVDAQTLAWDDPEADPAGFDAVLLRATWNYAQQPDAFRIWLKRTTEATRVFNPLEVVMGNLDKRYLLELEANGIGIVPTEYCAAGGSHDLDETLTRRGWAEVVIKPVVGAGSFLTERFGPDQLDAARAFLTEQCRDRDMLVQRFMPSVGTRGERAVVWIDGEISHAVHKHPRFKDDDERVEKVEALTVNERAFCAHVGEQLPDDCLYGRIDIIHDDDGTPLLSELELIEPSLFFPFESGSADQFVRATLARLT